MKKLLLGMIIGAAITSAVFYYFIKQDESEARENLKDLLASVKNSKTTQQQLDELVNTSGTSGALAAALKIITTGSDELYYYTGSDCSKMIKTTMADIVTALAAEKKMIPAEKLMIIIKKIPGSSFRNSMNLLDAITAAGIGPGHFAETVITEKENNCLQTIRNTP